MNTYSYPDNIFQSKFISDEGLNGSPCGFWVSKNNLFTKNNSTDTLILHIYYDHKAKLANDGTFKLEIKPSMDFKYFTGKINSSQIGAFNIKGHYKIELPYHSEYNSETNKEITSNQKTDIQIIYSLKISDKLFIGLDYYSRIDVLEKKIINKQIYYKEEQRRYEAAELPVIVRK